MNQPRIMIAGTSSNVGKTTITMGLLAAIGKRQVVQGYKVGPDYIDPSYHTYITKRNCRNLDGYLMDDITIKTLFVKHMHQADIGIIEGVMGLYDGVGTDKDIGSSASIAKTLSCPVVLVVDGSGVSTSVAAIVKGFADFDKDVDIQGIILNKVNTKRHYELLKTAIEQYTHVTCYGYLPKNNIEKIQSRHLGLIPSIEMKNLDEKTEQLRNEVEKTIDVEGIINLANKHQQTINIPKQPDIPQVDTVHIGVAYDEGFHFYYKDNLELLESMGATLHYFSPIRDTHLPEQLDLLYFGGGFPEVFAKALERNVAIKEEILKRLDQGIPYFAECGGLMYLNKELIDLEGNKYEMVGWFDGQCRMTKRLQRFGYKTLTLKEDTLLGPKGTEVNIHEFHHSEAVAINAKKVYDLKKERDGQIVNEYECGYCKGNGVAGYPHIHFYSNLQIPVNLLKAAMQISRDGS
ncbi:cobyrinic acid a,c-diamide synthase [Natranaerovirga hydrolytica]|uniref:Cobyrinate a,c-diamide synthase n=1 Tax=Natranaerovirga hydrolytica TaxID=680378 RepID=A0A4V2Q1R5_9FIRM|nr:cobyrinate a,c-diamide synthase [Natranaerovirga hydrolytica]TCK98651.1 cobyrinic acid a,c-diamide synthase [Natranaerovirga hydrolytica]